MKSDACELVPLTADDKAMLFTIYDSRRRFMFLAYIFLIGMAILDWCQGIDIRTFTFNFELLKTDHGYRNWFICLFFIPAIIIATASVFLIRRVLPFRRDIKSGFKEKVPYTVIRKEYFPLTDQYYLALDDPEYEFHETNADMYNAVNEGDTLYLYRAKYSKYVFEENGRFSIA